MVQAREAQRESGYVVGLCGLRLRMALGPVAALALGWSRWPLECRYDQAPAAK